MSKPYWRNCEMRSGMTMPEDISRVALTIEYNGMNFKGFQKQSSTPNTVQAALENALSNVANEPIIVSCAGRTDSGVHATQQVVHFDTAAKRIAKAWGDGVNTQLPDGVRVTGVYLTVPAFHARFSATARTYQYVMSRTSYRPAILSGLASWVKHELDPAKMQSAAEHLVGEHDFTSFRAAHCQALQPVRTIKQALFIDKGDLLIFQIKANAFLYHMVRNIMGVLIDVGRGAKPVDWVPELFELKNRCRASPTAPPHGLYFVAADYDTRFGVPCEPLSPGFLGV